MSLWLWGLEAHAIVGLCLFTFALWDIHAKPDGERRIPEGASAAVFITTYDEPVEILLPAVAAAREIKGSVGTWVLDDKNRPEIRELAEELGANYIGRTENTDAKAGNINNALEQVDVDFVALFDADHVAHADFLVRTLPYFSDPDIALVQTPQDFYNDTSFEHVPRRKDGSDYTEQSLFYRIIQPTKNRWGAAFWCGTSAVLRTEALRSVGGVATGAITEDIQTTIRLHRKGWKSYYHNEVLARGLAAPTSEEYRLQRKRWCIGAMQTLRLERPLRDRRMSLAQRLNYASTFGAWFDSFRVLGFALIPALVLVTGRPPLDAPLGLFVVAFATYFLLQQAAMFALGRGHLRPLPAIVFDLVRLQSTMGAIYKGFTGKAIPFRVTPKGRNESATGQRIPRLLYGLTGLYLFTIMWFVASVVGLTGFTYENLGIAYGAAFWLLFNAFLVRLAIGRIASPSFSSERRRSHRHRHYDRPATLNGRRATIADVSFTGARVIIDDQECPAGGEPAQLDLAPGISLTGTVVRNDDPSPEALSIVSIDFDPGNHRGKANLALVEGLFHPAPAA